MTIDPGVTHSATVLEFEDFATTARAYKGSCVCGEEFTWHYAIQAGQRDNAKANAADDNTSHLATVEEHRTARGECLAFTRGFPLRSVGEAIGYEEAGQINWVQARDLFAVALAAAVESVR